MKLHRHGDTVVVTGATHEKGAAKGKPYEHHGRFTDTWIKHDTQWLCVASQLSLIPKPHGRVPPPARRKARQSYVAQPILAVLRRTYAVVGACFSASQPASAATGPIPASSPRP